MIYRISARLAFTSEVPIEDVKDKILDVFDQAITINPGTDYAERSFWMLEECHHDENPPTECTVTEEHHTN